MDKNELEKVKNPFVKYGIMLGIFSCVAFYFFYKTFLPKFYFKDKQESVSEEVIQNDGQNIYQKNVTILRGIDKDIVRVQCSFVKIDSKLLIVNPLNNLLTSNLDFPFKLQILKQLNSIKVFALIPSDVFNQTNQPNESKSTLDRT